MLQKISVSQTVQNEQCYVHRKHLRCKSCYAFFHKHNIQTNNVSINIDNDYRSKCRQIHIYILIYVRIKRNSTRCTPLKFGILRVAFHSWYQIVSSIWRLMWNKSYELSLNLKYIWVNTMVGWRTFTECMFDEVCRSVSMLCL